MSDLYRTMYITTFVQLYHRLKYSYIKSQQNFPTASEGLQASVTNIKLCLAPFRHICGVKCETELKYDMRK